jgi:subtilase family serine protease
MMHRAALAAGVAAVVGVGAPAASASPAASRPGPGGAAVQVWMAGRQRAAQRFVNAVSTPGSPSYKRFLSPVAYTQRFGPTAGQVRAVRSYLVGAGFTGVRASIDDDYVSARAPSIEANVGELAFPASVDTDVLAVTGLGGARPRRAGAGVAAEPRAKALPCSRYWGQRTKTFSPAFDGLTSAALPVCGYSATQIRAAYGLTRSDTGKGETIALIQVGAPAKMFRTLTDYAKRNGLPAPRADRYHEEAVGEGGRNRTCQDPAALEAPVDSEAAYAMAPAADQLMIDGDDCAAQTNPTQALFDAELAPLTGRGSRAGADIESSSYPARLSERSLPASQRRAEHAIALRAAAEGVSLLVASGDVKGVDSPASDPDVTAVGGTTLGLSARGERLFETGWSTAVGERSGTSGPWQASGLLFAAGGGASTLYREPGYQRGVVATALSRSAPGHAGRTVPDISADGDPGTGMLFEVRNVTGRGKTLAEMASRFGGTSMAAPLVAGIVADAGQGRHKSFGFLNPLLYSLAGSTAYHDVLPLSSSAPQIDRAYYTTEFASGFQVAVDDAQGSGLTRQVTAPGYDTMTGLGTPNGSAFLKALRSGG